MASNPNGKELHMTSIHDVAAKVRQGPLHVRTTQPRVNAEPQAPSETPARVGQHARRDNATERQMEFVTDLVADLRHTWTPEQAAAVDRQLAQGLTFTQASDWIGRMKDARDKMRREQREASRRVAPNENAGSVANTLGANQRQRTQPDAGMYRGPDGTIYRVYLGQQSGRNLVKQVVGDKDSGYSYEYMGAASRCLPSNAQRLTLAEAKHWGKMTGHCCVCARRLDVPESVEAGIGPVCSKRVEL